MQRVWLSRSDTWYNFWSDAQTIGSDTAEKSYVTSTGEIIMYVKVGSLLPRYKYAQSTAFLDKSQLELEVYTGRDGSFTLYEDDGVSEEFRGGAAATTELGYAHAALRVTVGHPAGTYSGAPAARRYVVRLHGLTAPVGMRVNGGAGLPAFTGESAAVLNGAGQVWNPARKILTVVTPMIGVGAGGGVAAVVEPSGGAFPAPSPRVVYEAEDAARSGAAIASQHRGYTGGGYLDYAGASGDYIEWTVAVPAAGTYPLGFRYANGGTADRPLRISVNDAVVAAQLSFPPTGAWSTWRTAILNVPLPSGAAVRIRATTTGAGGGNLDSLSVG
nr:hypothetical protein GCM10020092_056350 [Actinoplanes digitatis]